MLVNCSSMRFKGDDQFKLLRCQSRQKRKTLVDFLANIYSPNMVKLEKTGIGTAWARDPKEDTGHWRYASYYYRTLLLHINRRSFQSPSKLTLLSWDAKSRNSDHILTKSGIHNISCHSSNPFVVDQFQSL